jgi:hypothetical protein
MDCRRLEIGDRPGVEFSGMGPTMEITSAAEARRPFKTMAPYTRTSTSTSGTPRGFGPRASTPEVPPTGTSGFTLKLSWPESPAAITRGLGRGPADRENSHSPERAVRQADGVPARNLDRLTRVYGPTTWGVYERLDVSLSPEWA